MYSNLFENNSLFNYILYKIPDLSLKIYLIRFFADSLLINLQVSFNIISIYWII